MSEFPIGSFVRTEKGSFFIASPTKRYRFISKRCLNSWKPNVVVNTKEKEVAGYKVAGRMKFRNNSLIHNFVNGKIYLIEQGKRRLVTSPDVLKRLGFKRRHIVTVSLAEINLHEEGAVLE